jgi:protein LSM14
MSVPYIGARISLVSRSEVRYEGILYNISTADSTLALSSVKAFGTEGRRKDGPQVPPNPELFEYVIFRGADIKELEVCAAAPAPAAAPVFSDPAIVSSAVSSSSAVGSASSSAAAPRAPVSSAGAPLAQPSPAPPPPSAPAQQQQQQQQQQQHHQQRQQQQHQQQQGGWRGNNTGSSSYSQNNQRGRGGHQQGFRHENDHRGGRSGSAAGARGPAAGTGAHLLTKRTRLAPGGASGDGPADATGAFDFGEMNEKFDKESELAEFSKLALGGDEADAADSAEESGAVAAPSSSVYNKSKSFFDDISCDMKDRSAGRPTGLYGQEERELNKETFGAVGLMNTRGRGGYQGGRGGYRGGGGGGGGYNRGYNNNYNSDNNRNNNSSSSNRAFYNNSNNHRGGYNQSGGSFRGARGSGRPAVGAPPAISQAGKPASDPATFLGEGVKISRPFE